MKMIPHYHCHVITVFLSFLAMLLTYPTALVSAQSSCSTAESIVAPFTIDSFTMTSESELLFVTATCDEIQSVATVDGAGQWFSFVTTETTVVQILFNNLEGPSQSFWDNDPQIFKGSCDALTCVENLGTFGTVMFPAEAGVQYFIFVYRTDGSPTEYSFSFKEIPPPANDKMEDAFAITREDLPFKGEFTLDGSLSDFGQDACALGGEYGIWFTYTTTLPQDDVILETYTRSFLGLVNIIGVQARSGDSFTCITVGTSSDYSVEWIAEAGVEYYFLIADPYTMAQGNIEVTLRSRSLLQSSPGLPISPIPASPVSAPEPGAAPVTSQEVPASPVTVPEEEVTPVASPETPLDPSPTNTSTAPMESMVSLPEHGWGIGLVLMSLILLN